MIYGVLAQIAVEVDRLSENPRGDLCDRELARLVRGSSVTTHCHAATALLTREYQGDHRRFPLLPTASCAKHPARLTALTRSRRRLHVDNSFHIRSSPSSSRLGTRSGCSTVMARTAPKASLRELTFRIRFFRWRCGETRVSGPAKKGSLKCSWSVRVTARPLVDTT